MITKLNSAQAVLILAQLTPSLSSQCFPLSDGQFCIPADWNLQYHLAIAASISFTLWSTECLTREKVITLVSKSR